MVMFIPTSSTFWRLNGEDGNFEDNFGHGTRPVTDTASPPPPKKRAMVRTPPWRAQEAPAIEHRDTEVTSRDAEGDCHSAAGGCRCHRDSY